MGGRSARRKGADFERTMVHRFREVFGDEDVRRGLQSRGEEVPDVDVPCFWIECKREKHTNPKAALAQAADAASPPGTPPARQATPRRHAADAAMSAAARSTGWRTPSPYPAA